MAYNFHWQGIEWTARNSTEQEGPGPNLWSADNVKIDNDGQLHLKITLRNGQWTSAEVYTPHKYGFGRYVGYIEGAVDKFDPKVVFGLFTYPTAEEGPDGTNEIDIEWSKWGETDSDATNLAYTIYPSAEGGPIVSHKKKQDLLGTYTTSSFTWSPQGIKLQTYHGHTTDDRNKFFEWETPSSFADANPLSPVPIHMNLWVHQDKIPGTAPMDNQEVEVIIHKFTYTPQ